MRRNLALRAAAIVGGGLTLAVLTTRWGGLNWGATLGEVDEELPGDDVVVDVARTCTRAITIDAAPERVWPWVVQIGRGRGGFYSYDWVENLVGCDIHSADGVVADWQHLSPGDEVHLHPAAALRVVAVDPGHSLVLRGGPDERADFSWAFIVRVATGHTTRLVVRERYAAESPWLAPAIEVVTAVSTVMTRRMLLGIRERAMR